MMFGDSGFHRDCAPRTGLTTGTILVASYLSRWCLVILGFTETAVLTGLATGTILVASYFSRWSLVILGFTET